MKPGHEANRAGPHSSLQFVPLGGALGLEIGCRPGDEDGRALSRKMVRDAKGAPWFYGRSDMTFRIGNGFDVHAFGPGDHVTLCGIRIPHAAGLVGHSDADVAMHTVTDAVYGALAMGDIGTHFPPSDPQWRGAASEIFLRHAVALARENGFRPGNVDCTIICETP